MYFLAPRHRGRGPQPLGREMVAAFANTPEVRKEMWDAMLRGFALHRLLIDGAIDGHWPPSTVHRTA